MSFLALVLLYELERRLRRKSFKLKWADVLRDLGEVREVEVRHTEKHYILGPALKGVAGKVFGAVRKAMPLPAREANHSAKTAVRAP